MMATMKNATSLLALAAIVGLAACGGGGSGYGMSTTPIGTTTTVTSLAASALITPNRGTQTGFVNASGHAAYVFDLDSSQPGTSQCSGACAQNWPPLTVPSGFTVTAPWGTLAHADGSMQLTYNGRPLYAFVVDTQAGTANGDGVNEFGGLWHLAQP